MFFKPFLFRITAIFLGILLAILIVEILARFFYQEPWYEELAKTQIRSQKYQYTTNKDGLRDVEYPVIKPSNNRRILILGDSFTFGLGVPKDEDTFPEILEAKLNEQMISNNIRKIEVLNGGISGTRPDRWLRLYESISAKFDPDVVLIVFFLRDGTSVRLIRDYFQPIRSEITIRNRRALFYQYFFTYRLIKDLLDRSKISTRYTDNLKNGYLGDNKQTQVWQLTQKHLLSIKSLAYKNSATVGFVIFPALVELNRNYPFMDICKHLERFAISNGFQDHNLLPSFMGYYGPNLWVSAYDQHPNEKAHRIAAESMLPFIKDLLVAYEKKDEDNDGIPNAVDNCPSLTNPQQEDNDGDKRGNICDNCDNVFNPNQLDSNGDGIGDACVASELEKHWLEAEHADTVVIPLEIANDENASNGRFIYVPNGTGNEYTPGGKIMATYTVNISKAETYILWGRVKVADKRDNSFFVQIDDGLDNLWEIEAGDYWHWDEVNDRGILGPVRFLLKSGVHTIKIKLREDGTKLDKMLLTNDLTFVPSGKGDISKY